MELCPMHPTSLQVATALLHLCCFSVTTSSSNPYYHLPGFHNGDFYLLSFSWLFSFIFYFSFLLFSPLCPFPLVFDHFSLLLFTGEAVDKQYPTVSGSLAKVSGYDGTSGMSFQLIIYSSIFT